MRRNFAAMHDSGGWPQADVRRPEQDLVSGNVCHEFGSPTLGEQCGLGGVPSST